MMCKQYLKNSEDRAIRQRVCQKDGKYQRPRFSISGIIGIVAILLV